MNRTRFFLRKIKALRRVLEKRTCPGCGAELKKTDNTFPLNKMINDRDVEINFNFCRYCARQIYYFLEKDRELVDFCRQADEIARQTDPTDPNNHVSTLLRQTPQITSVAEELLEQYKPKLIKSDLDRFVIRQEQAKKILSVAVYNHIKKLYRQPADPGGKMLEKSNILLIGPTGCGKTLLADTLARFLKLPLAIGDANTFTEAGYVGDDVDMMLYNLLYQTGWNLELAQCGIIYIDEIDKICAAKNTSVSGRDPGGKGVQQALLRLIEGGDFWLNEKKDKTRDRKAGKFKFATDKLLVICGGTFSGLDENILRRLGRGQVGFGANVKRVGEQEYNKVIKDMENRDLQEFGILPELIGRLHVIARLEELNRDDLVRILLEPENALVSQCRELFRIDGHELTFTDGALEAIADEAIKLGTGARSLRAIMEKILLDIAYESPEAEPTIYEINEDFVRQNL